MATTSSTSVNQQKRPVALTVVLYLVIALTLFGGTHAIVTRDALMQEFPRMTFGVWLVYVALIVPAIVSKIAMLAWRRWGFWLTCLTSVLMAGLELYLQMGLKTIRVGVVLLVIALLVRPHWHRFR